MRVWIVIVRIFIVNVKKDYLYCTGRSNIVIFIMTKNTTGTSGRGLPNYKKKIVCANEEIPEDARFMMEEELFV